MQVQKKLQIAFGVMVILGGVIVISKIVPPITGPKHIRMVVAKNKKPITNLDMQPVTDYTIDTAINTIDFPVGDVFKHGTLGGFGVQSDFFAEFLTTMRVNKAGNYIFKIGSDDGFRFFIGSKMVGEFVKNRPYQENSYKVALSREDYQVILRFYQGYGPLGLRAYYQHEADVEWYFLGEDSGFMHFL